MLRSLRMAAETAAKRARTSGPLLIGTHNGHFHADEALAVYMLRLLPTYASSPLVRTRDPALLAECHTVVDVGGEYDPSTNRFDHHQREFNVTFPGHNTKLSSAGLVFKDLGKSIIASQTGLDESSTEVQTLYEKIYTDFIEAFDANDNGVTAYDVGKLQDMGLKPRFNDRGFSIASVVNRFNYGSKPNASIPEETKSKEQVQQEEDERFSLASAFTGQQFSAELSDTFHSWLPARALVKRAFSSRKSANIDAEGRILVLPYRQEGLPWQDHLFSLEEEDGCQGSVLYALFAESGEPDSKWRIRAVSRSKEGFELRKPLPEAWRGVRDEELDNVSGISGSVFVHASGFIGGNKTYAGALAMAKRALEIE